MATFSKSYGIITTDKFLKIKIWNEWLERASGLAASETIGKKITAVIPNLEQRKLLPRFQKSLDSGTVEVLSSTFHKYLIPCKIENAEGETSYMLQHVTIGPLRTEKEIIGLVITVEDATDFHKIIVEKPNIKENYENLGHKDWGIRKQAGIDFARKASKSSLASLLEKIKKEHQDINVLNSILLIMSLSDVDVVGELLSLLDGDDIDLKIYVIQALGERQDPQSITTLIHCLNDADANIRYHAIEALGKLEAREAAEQLCEIALSGDFFVTFPAIDALSKIGDPSVISKLMPLMNDPIYEDALMHLIGRLGEADTVEYITIRINEPKANVLPAVKALVYIHERYENFYQEGELIKDIINKHVNANGVQNLIQNIERSELNEIQFLVKALGWINNIDAQKALTRMLGNPSLQKEVVEAFVNFGNRVSDLLIEHLNADDPDTRNAAAIALGRIGDPNSVDALIKMIGENDDLTVFVIGSLAKLGDSKAFEPLINQLAHPNPSIRRAVIAALNSIGHPDMPAKIKEMIQFGNSLQRESAIQIAGYFGYPECKKLVENCIDDIDMRVACTAIENIPFFEDNNTKQLLTRLFLEGSTRIRTAAVKAARHIEAKDDFKMLSLSLNDEDNWIRYYAIRTITNLYLREYLPKLMLMARSDQAVFARMAAIEGIGLMNGTDAIGVLAEILNEENNDLVLASINSLGMLEKPEALDLLMKELNNPEHNRKIAAIKAISRFNTDEVAEKLYLLAENESNRQLRDYAIEGLSSMRNKLATEFLIKLSENIQMLSKCIDGLIKQKNFALPFLNEIFNKQSLNVQRNIIEFYSRAKNQEATKMLVSLVNSEKVQVRVDAMRALHRIGYQGVTEKIEDVIQNDPDFFVRHQAKEILKKK